MLELIEYAKRLVKENKVDKIGEVSTQGQLYEVSTAGKTYLVRIFTKKGRNIMTCECSNSSRFPNEAICVHKLAAIFFEGNENFYEKIDKMIKLYKQGQTLKFNPSFDCMIDDLEELRRLK